MRGSRGMCVGSGEWTISSIENSTYAHNKITLKKKISVPPPRPEKQIYPLPQKKYSGSAHAKHFFVPTIEILLFSY